MVRRVDAESARRIQPRDRVRLVRALEVYFLTGRPLTAHFADTMAPLDFCDVHAIGLRIPAALTAERVARRVDEQFARGLMDEVRALLGARRARSTRIRSAASSTDRRSSCCTACATRPRRARSSSRRTVDTRAAS